MINPKWWFFEKEIMIWKFQIILIKRSNQNHQNNDRLIWNYLDLTILSVWRLTKEHCSISFWQPTIWTLRDFWTSPAKLSQIWLREKTRRKFARLLTLRMILLQKRRNKSEKKMSGWWKIKQHFPHILSPWNLNFKIILLICIYKSEI